MKIIEVSAIITGVRSKIDRSLGVSLTTPELTTEERAEFMNLQGVNLKATFTPTDEVDAPKMKIDKDLSRKPQSVRIRNVLYLVWKQFGEKGDFNQYYHDQTEKIIEYLKGKLE